MQSIKCLVSLCQHCITKSSNCVAHCQWTQTEHLLARRDRPFGLSCPLDGRLIAHWNILLASVSRHVSWIHRTAAPSIGVHRWRHSIKSTLVSFLTRTKRTQRLITFPDGTLLVQDSRLTVPWIWRTLLSSKTADRNRAASMCRSAIEHRRRRGWSDSSGSCWWSLGHVRQGWPTVTAATATSAGFAGKFIYVQVNN